MPGFLVRKAQKAVMRTAVDELKRRVEGRLRTRRGRPPGRSGSRSPSGARDARG